MDGDANGCAKALLDEAISLLRKERAGEALGRLEQAHALDPGCARVRSHYGLCLALAERRFEKAVELCRSAVKQEFFNPELYLNLARVHLLFGFKAEALRYLRRGKMIDPGNPEILGELRRLGRRRSQVLGFLPRGHLLNRLLGRARERIRTVA